MIAGLVSWTLFMFRTKHPPGLYVLFFTEMWERFSFYCMNAIFMLYMTSTTNGHPFLQRHASIINGLYFGMAYFLPFFGGLLADQKWGYRLTIILGALTMGMGHLFLAVDELPFFFAGLIALAIGNGLFKPNISTLVGKLYAPNDPRLDSAFTIFYMGINIGAFTSPIVAAYLKERYGFHTAFGAAGIGMGICICIFVSCRRWLVFTNPQPGGNGVADRTVTAPAAVQRQRHMALVIIFVLVIFFWMAFNQGGNTFPQWFRDNTDRTPPAWWPRLPFLLDAEGNFSAALSSAINPFFVIAFSPLMVLLWSGLRRGSLEPSTPAKMGLGMLLTAVAFTILMLGGAAWRQHTGRARLAGIPGRLHGGDHGGRAVPEPDGVVAGQQAGGAEPAGDVDGRLVRGHGDRQPAIGPDRPLLDDLEAQHVLRLPGGFVAFRRAAAVTLLPPFASGHGHSDARRDSAGTRSCRQRSAYK